MKCPELELPWHDVPLGNSKVFETSSCTFPYYSSETCAFALLAFTAEGMEEVSQGHSGPFKVKQMFSQEGELLQRQGASYQNQTGCRWLPGWWCGLGGQSLSLLHWCCTSQVHPKQFHSFLIPRWKTHQAARREKHRFLSVLSSTSALRIFSQPHSVKLHWSFPPQQGLESVCFLFAPSGFLGILHSCFSLDTNASNMKGTSKIWAPLTT